MKSFGIDTKAGEFLGEFGIGIAETVEVSEPRKVSALEIWLFDKNDIKNSRKSIGVKVCLRRPRHPGAAWTKRRTYANRTSSTVIA